MNLKTIKLLPSSLSVQICIGRMGEHGVTEVEFDLSEFENTYGSGTPELLFRPKNSSESYPVPLINDGGSNYKWIVNLPTTAKSGSHVATMRWYVGEDLAKSCDIQCHVESVSDVVVGDMPDPVKDWLDKLMNNLPAGGVTPDQIHKLIAEYMTQNPIETLTEKDIKAIVESYGYLTEDSDTIYDDTEIRGLIDEKADKSEIPDLTDYAKKEDIPEPQDLSDYALKSEIPDVPDPIDVQINGTSIVQDGVASIPIGKDRPGLLYTGKSGIYGIALFDSGELYLVSASEANINNRNYGSKPITSGSLDYAVKAAMTDGKGPAWTPEEQARAQERMGIYPMSEEGY